MDYPFAMSEAPIFLIGMPGSGKTTIGKLVADLLHRDFYDCDQVIEIKHERTIAEIFADVGEDVFRNWETSVLHTLSEQRDTVIATGGGVILREENRTLLQHFPVVYLESNLPILLNQTRAQNTRPLLDGNRKNTLSQMLETRNPLYAEVADRTIDVSRRHPSEAAKIIYRWVRDGTLT